MKNFSFLVVLIAILTSCSSQKKLQRRIEKHGIKESVSFVVLHYNEYFRADSVILTDTITVFDTLEVPKIDIKANLTDSLDYLVHYSDSLRLVINKKTGVARVFMPSKTIYLTDTVVNTVVCPEVICPDVQKLQSNIKNGLEIPSFVWLLVAFLIGLYSPKIFRGVLGLVKP